MKPTLNLDLPFTKADKLRCAERELALRQRVYERLIAAGKMLPETAEREIAIMSAIADDYRDK